MKSREPAGCECDGGKSAEFRPQACGRGGAVENTCGTVCGDEPQVRYPLTEPPCVRTGQPVGRSVPLPTFSLAPVKINAGSRPPLG